MEVEVFGEVQNTLDAKGRVSIPSRFQALFLEGGWLTRSFNGRSLVFYPQSEWNKFLQRIKDLKAHADALDPSSLVTADRAIGKLVRFISCGVRIASLDNQNRIAIPAPIRTWAKIEPEHEVTMIGMGDTLEFWSTEVWRAYNETEMSIDDLEKSLEALSMRPAAV